MCRLEHYVKENEYLLTSARTTYDFYDGHPASPSGYSVPILERCFIVNMDGQDGGWETECYSSTSSCGVIGGDEET